MKIINNNNNSDETCYFGSMVKEEETMISYTSDQESISLKVTNKETSSITNVPFAIQLPESCDQLSAPKNKGSHDELLKSAKVEMGEVKGENERLKLLLTSIVKDYQSLQKHFSDTLQQQEEEKEEAAKKLMVSAHTHQQNEEAELVSLSLGRFPSQDQPRKDDKKISTKDDKHINGELALGLSSKFESLGSPEIVKNIISSSDNCNFEENLTELWPPSKILKTTKNGEDEVSQQTLLKKARVSIRARCDAQTINDGCQWRKYGQKIAKGNPCPRAYYRCTVSPSCPVRKQVQRCSNDMTILITTYEGTHNHPLPLSATAMASTTSAAVSLLQSHSSSSSLPGSSNSSTSAPISMSAANYSSPNLNYNSFTTSFQNPTKQLYNFPNASISTFNSHPTITLDLTVPSTSSHFGSFSSLFPRSYSNSTSLNFSSTSSEPNNIQSTSWNNFSRYFNHGTISQNTIENQIGVLNGSNINGSNQPFQEAYNLYHQRPHNYNISNIIQSSSGSKQTMELTDTMTAATKEITSNPKFQSALAAAISSYLGNNKSIADGNESSGMNLKWGTESLSVSSISSPGQCGINCKSSFLKK